MQGIQLERKMQHRDVTPAISDEVNAVIGNHVVKYAAHGVIEGDMRRIGCYFHFEQLMALSFHVDADGLPVDVILLDGIISRLVTHMGETEFRAFHSAIVGKTTFLIGDGNQQRVFGINAHVLDGLTFFVFDDTLDDGMVLAQKASEKAKQCDKKQISFHGNKVKDEVNSFCSLNRVIQIFINVFQI